MLFQETTNTKKSWLSEMEGHMGQISPSVHCQIGFATRNNKTFSNDKSHHKVSKYHH